MKNRRLPPKHRNRGARSKGAINGVDPYGLENVSQTIARFRIPEAKMRELRRLAAEDPETDPWIGDLTHPDEFKRWLWGKRRELDKMGSKK